ncbi:MAG: NAD(P)-dependent oxidoreductase [Anaerolineae bacterium]|nr:NAD(P)-dependent oxidoreductase [Anaerolineae bacterium]
MKLVITGSKGLIGSHTVDYARKQDGVEVLVQTMWGWAASTKNYLSADLADYGQTVGALAGADAVIHLAAIRDHGMVPNARAFAINVNSTYNVLEAAVQLGIKRVVLASSIQASRTVLMRNETRYKYLPIDEDLPLDPQNDYALAKQVGEVMGEMFAKHFGLTVVNLRFTAITHPDNIKKNFPWPQAKPPHWAMYAYADVRDAARCAYLAATAPLPANAHFPLFVVAKDTMVNTPSAEIARRYFPDAEDRGLQGFDSLVSGKRAEQLLGFVPEFGCRGLT